MPKPPSYDDEPPSMLTDEQWKRVQAKLERIFDEEIAILLIAQLKASTSKWGWCPKHGRIIQFRAHDVKANMEAIKFIVSYDKGTPVQRKEIDFKAKIEHTAREIREMSDAELLELAAAEEAEWTPVKSLPAAS